ncbi:helix-turn-helix transcriptional regulator [Aquabacterium sp.]|uniref:helix-turn-helix transcriptional regulator n=1 Tax=Aquabacterium sp. TaxID=1872578 RepID=UPI0035B29534
MSILRMPAVKAETGYRSHASIYNAIKAGLFTKPVSIGQRSVGWPDDEVRAICAARIAGKSDDEIRALVMHLHAKRTERLAALVSQ